MLTKLTGWTAITLALLALAPSFVPGVMSIFGYLLSLVALLLAIFTIKPQQVAYFKATALIVGLGMLVVNPTLSLYALPEPGLTYKLFAYGLFVLLCVWGLRKADF